MERAQLGNRRGRQDGHPLKSDAAPRYDRWHSSECAGESQTVHPRLVTTCPELLTLELLGRLDRTLRGLGALISKRWEPGLTREQIDALTEPHGFRLPDEAALVGGAGTTGQAAPSSLLLVTR